MLKYSAHFETRGRGWTISDFPVELEPPFCPLYYLLDSPEAPVIDDGRKPTFLSRWIEGRNGEVENNSSALSAYRQQLAERESFIARAMEPYACQYYHEAFDELQLVLPKDLKVSKSAAENLLLSFSYLEHPVSFEVIGNRDRIVIQFACSEKDLTQVSQQLKAHLPSCAVRKTSGYLSDLWINGPPNSLIVDFGLSNDFFLPLKTSPHFEPDLFVTVIGALSNLRENEIGVFQVLCQKAKNDWAQEIIDSTSYLEEAGAFSKNSNVSHFAKEKCRSPIFAGSIRIAGGGFNEQRTWQIIKSLGAGLSTLSNPAGNELIPLSNDNYPKEYHEQGLLNRQSFRDGMLLNLEELGSIVRPPSSAVQSEKLQRETEQTKPAPSITLNHQLLLGINYHQSEIREVSLSNEQRTRHMHLIGSSGSGKSSLLLNLIKQDLENNQGLCVIDPHGDLIDSVIENIPENRIGDVTLFDPSDSEFPIGFNILKAASDLEKTLLSSDLVATFRRMSTSWGDVMDSVLANAILAFVESSRGGTLFELKRFLVEKDFRHEFLKTVNDEGVRYFWINEFPLITGKPQSSILIRLDTFLRQKLIRNIVCQKENKINFREIMDNRKILLIKLSQGLIGEENSYLLGTLLVSKLYQTALSRQDSSNRPYFWLYMDEFHHFITPSMESVLSGVRKYNLGLILAHQEFRQLQSRSPEVASSVLSNCFTRICFRLGDTDAEKFASGFSFFDAKALQNLGIGEAVARVERADYDFNLKTNLLPKVEKSIAERQLLAILHYSREKYGTPKNEVEEEIGLERVNKINLVPPSETTQAAMSEVNEKPLAEKRTEEIFVKKPIASPSLPEAAPTDSLSPPKTVSEDTQQHKYLQSLVKRMAESKGFRVTIEKEVFGGVGRIDVALENETERIACEISVSNEPDYELQNIRKCLAAGYPQMVMISANARHLEKIRQKAEECLPADDLARIHFFTPEEFHAWLENRAVASAESSAKVKGFKVNVKLKPVDETDRSTRKKAISDVIFGGLKKLVKKGKNE